ncbi:MAG: hypothetical protein JNG84_06925 [Archangium sp.]|nr:hypothetical protein [Archangium sp.]
MRLRLLTLICVLFAAGCTPPAGPRFEITDPGQGEPNTEALIPLSVGYRVGERVVDGVVESKHGPLFRLAAAGALFFTLYLVDERGVFYAGSADDGVLDEPQLIIPATVRLGMTWTVRGAGEPLHFAVSGRAVKSTRFGERATWTITSTNASDGGAPGSATYIEGRGAEETRAIVFDPPAPVAPSKKPLTLEEIPYTEQGYSTEPSMVRIGTGRALLLGTSEGSDRGLCRFFDGTQVLAETPPGDKGPITTTQGLSCVYSDECTITSNHVDVCQTVSTGHANGAHVNPGGSISWVPRGRGGGPVGATEGYLGTRSDHLPGFLALGHIDGPSGGGRTLFGGDGFGAHGDALALDSATAGVPLAGNLGLVPAYRRIAPLRTDADGETPYILIDVTGLWWTVRIRASGSQPLPIAAGFLSGKLSVRTTDTETEVLRVTPDGQIDRVTVAPGAGGLVMEHLADVALKKSEVAVGAWRWSEPGGERLIVASIGPGGLEGLRTHLYRSKEAPGAPVPLPIDPALALYAGGAGGDPSSNGDVDGFVCWPGDGASDFAASAFSFVGHRAGSRCAFLLGASDTAVEGTFPGIGHALVVTDGRNTRNLGTDAVYDDAAIKLVAPLAGGGFVTPSRTSGPGGLYEGRPQHAELWRANGTPTVDLAGGGLWFTSADGALVLLGRPSRRIEVPGGGVFGLRFPMPGGGVVVVVELGTMPGSYLARADGTLTPVAALPSPTDFTPCTGFADGTVCGDRRLPGTPRAYTWSCRGGAGPAIDVALGSGMVCPGRVALADGSLLTSLQSNPSSDEDLLQVIALADRSGLTRMLPTVSGVIMSVSRASDGTAWGFARSLNGTSTYPVKLTRDGISEVTDFTTDREVQQQDMLVDEALYLHRTAFGMRRLLRPR